MEPAPEHRDGERANWDFFQSIPELDRSARRRTTRSRARSCSSRCSSSPGACAGLRRDAVPEADEPALRRPDDRRQRHRLLVDLRRQPADDSVDDQRERARARPGPTRCSRTTPSSAWACGWPRPAGRPALASCSRRLAPQLGDELVAALLGGEPGDRGGDRAQRGRVAQLKRATLARRTTARPRCRRRHLLAVADALVRKSVWIVGGDGWAYDIGFGGARPRPGLGPQRQHPGARHRGLLEHRRPGVEVDAARRGGQVRGRGQGHGQEGPRGDRPVATATSTWPRSRWAPTTCRRPRPSSRPRPSRARR